MSRTLDIADDALEFVHRVDGHHELVLQESLGPVGTVPLTDEVERMVELRQVLHLPDVVAAGAVVELADR